MTISIRPLDRSDAQALADLGDYAFLGDPTRPDRMRGVGTIDWNQAFGAWRVQDPSGSGAAGDPALRVRADDQMAGCYVHFSLRLGALGPLGTVRAHDLAGLAWVAVHPDHRRRGVLSQLIAHHHADLREQGIAWSGLHASETSIYGRFGYAPASLNVEYTLNRGVALRAPDHVRAAADAIDVQTVFDLDEEIAARVRRISLDTQADTLGAITWPEAKELAFLRDNPQERHGRGEEPSRVLIASLPTGPGTGAADERGAGGAAGADAAGGRRDVGFAIYRRTDAWEGGQPRGTVDVRSLRAHDPATLLALGRRLADMDLMGRVTLRDRGLDDPLMWWAGGPRAVGARAYDGLWLRPIDVGAALGGRGYLGALDVVLDIVDEACPWNAGAWRLAVGEDGVGICERTTSPADARVDVRALGATYLGRRGFTSLAATGEVEEHTRGAVAALTRAFTTGCAPIGGLGF